MYEDDVSKSNMWREVHEQPEIIRHVIDVNLPIIENICKEVDNRNISKVLLVGRGSSEHALLVGKYAFEIYTDKLTSMAYPSIITLLDGKLDLSDVLTIGVSQCGEAKDVYTVLEKCQNQGGIAVSVTNEHECLMRNVGNYYINCECGKETSFTAAKSYMSQMVITLLFAAVLSHDEKVLEQIKKAPDIIEQSLCKNIEEQVKKSVPLFRNVQDILLLGRGFSYAVANETELKIMEASYTNAKAYSSCDYPHGPIRNPWMCHHVCCYHPCTASTEADRIICRVGQRVYSLFPLIKLHVSFSFIRLYGFPAFFFLQHCTTPPFVVSLFS